VAARFTIAEVQVGDVTILRLSGRLELEEGDLVFRDWINRLVDEGHLKILLDLKAVTRIDSAGIGMLVSKYLSTQKRGGTIKLVQLTRRSDHLMDITRLATCSRSSTMKPMLCAASPRRRSHD
jgi:stage II sporulation protein AA (anti-sigma F factor antagonist)